ncbi:DUF2332 domain-containing protein [Acidimangrovimonas pyrenivorans]|uniref:DUF2332 domain-containing protein n=1 Tax=Acidimangrovimonas pyrenivorans TaxID=2030798 RepID=A0ABV7AJX5_9RHOB
MTAPVSLPEAFRLQARACAGLGSPFMARLLPLLADRLHPGTALTDRLFGWPRDLTARGDAVPLRLAGGLHALVLSGQDDALAAAYADWARLSDDALVGAVLEAMARHQAFLLDWLDNAPQTNEVRRAAALIAAGHWLADRFGLPLVLSELGASAGLNLLWDRYALEIDGHRYGPDAPVLTLTPDWDGPLPPQTAPEVTERRGVDLNPLAPGADRLRLLAYLWADQSDRLARTAAALDAAAQRPPPVDRGDAAGWAEARLAEPRPGALHLVYHTIAAQYFPAETRARLAAALQAAGARATPEAPLAHLAMEADEATPGAGLTLQTWPGGRTHALGRVDFHGRWLRWTPPAGE